MENDLGPKKKRKKKYNPLDELFLISKNIEQDYQKEQEKEEEYIASLDEGFTTEEERFGLDEDEYLYVLMEDDLI